MASPSTEDRQPILSAKVVRRLSARRIEDGSSLPIKGERVAGAEIVFKGHRLYWFSGGRLQQSYPVVGPVKEVAFCSFRKDEQPQLCVLESKQLQIFSTEGDHSLVVLPAEYTSLFPLDSGLLLAGAEDAPPRVLPLPTEDLQPVAAEIRSFSGAARVSTAGNWSNENVVWIGREPAAFALTYSKSNQRLRLWHIKEASGSNAANNMDNSWRTPQTKLQRQVLSSPASSGLKRPSIRLPNGTLSPAAFSPVPQNANGGPLPPVTLLPSQPLPFIMVMVAEQRLPEDMEPASASLFNDLDGSGLLAVQFLQGHLTAIRLPQKDAFPVSGAFEAAFECKAVASVGVVREGIPLQNQHGGRQTTRPKDLMVLGADKSLRLHAGASLVFNVRLQAQPSEERRDENAASASGKAQASSAALASPRSDISMAISQDSDAEIAMESPGVAGNVSVQIAGLKESATQGFATLVFEDGHEVAVAAPFLPPSETLAAAFSALHHLLSINALSQFMSHLHAQLNGGSLEDLEHHWKAFAAAVLSWATEAQPGSRQAVLAEPVSAWEALQRSEEQRAAVAEGIFPGGADFLDSRGESRQSGKTAAEAGQALLALHALYEDFKLDVKQWHSLQPFGRLLESLADLLGAAEYVDFYQRDLGSVQAANAPSSQSSAGQELPADVNAALFALLTGNTVEPWLPPLLGSRPPIFLQRSSDVLHFYALLAEERGKLSARQPGKPASKTALQKGACKLVLAMVERGWDQARLQTLPFGVALPLREALHRCKRAPPPGWPVEAYQLIGRADIVANLGLLAEKQGLGAGVEGSPTASSSSGSQQRVSLPARTPLRQPQLRTPMQGRARSRMSTGGDPVIAAAAAAAVASPPPLPAQETSSQLRRQPGMPYSIGLHINGLGWKEADSLDPDSKDPDGMEGLEQIQKKQRFGPDLRLMEVRRLLQSSRPTPIHIKNAATVADAELSSLQQKRLMALAVRTMALPTGRAALTLGTLTPLPTEPLEIPRLNLAGLLPEQQNAVVKLDLTATTPAPGGGASADFTAWPEFHNGVAAGLKLSPGGNQLTRTWIVYNKPKEPSYTHAGMLMGLGLTGHLNCLAATDLYRYLSQEHDATTAGVLLGMAAAKRATSDATISKMLFLHVPTRHPAAYPELELSPLVQAAALLGVGLLYQGSCHRLTAEIMLEEIGRRPGDATQPKATASTMSSSGSTVSADREGYALAAGLALGLICLGQGRNAVGLADMKIEDRLRYFMIGGKDPRLASRSGKHLESQAYFATAGSEMGAIGFDPTQGGEMPWSQPGVSPRDHRSSSNVPTAPQGQSQLVIEGSVANLDVTAPGATLALALMYLKTNDKSVADTFLVPSTHFELDLVRPDFIMIRVLAKSLVMWESVQPTENWILSQLPPILQGPLETVGWGPSGAPVGNLADLPEDPEAIAQAHVNAVTGACLSIGIRFAGTADADARQTLLKYVEKFLRFKMEAPDPFTGAAAVWGRLDKQTMENCMNVIAVALSLVLAGTGDKKACQLLRGLRRRLSQGPLNTAGAVFFGNHMAISMAIGFLFYGGGSRTLGTSNASVAALVISLFPRFPLSPTDNRCHLQVFRHLHVLASESRCLEAEDVCSKQLKQVPIRVFLKAAAGEVRRPLELKTPCLIPEFGKIEKLELKDEEHHSLQLLSSDPAFAAVVRSGKLFVQRQGFREQHSLALPAGGLQAEQLLAKEASTSGTLLNLGLQAEEAVGTLEASAVLNLLLRAVEDGLRADPGNGSCFSVAIWNLRLAVQAEANLETDDSLSGAHKPLLPRKQVRRIAHKLDLLLGRGSGGASAADKAKAYLRASEQPAATEQQANQLAAYLTASSLPSPSSSQQALQAAPHGFPGSTAQLWLQLAASLPRSSAEAVKALAAAL